MTMRTLISTLLLFCFNSYAQSWKPITPIENCSDFKIYYQQLHNKAYKVKIKINGLDEIYDVANINDLSVITDEISIASAPICNGNLSSTTDTITCNPNIIHSTQYKNFLEESANIVAKLSGENKCDQLNDYLELQTKVDGLSNIANLSIKKSKNFAHIFFKLLVDEETDEMIDLFNACGKKKQSHKFIKNMILLEVKNNCIAPMPPGYMSFQDADTISEQISEKYKNLSLAQISTKKKRIEDEAIETFTDIALESEIKNLVGDYITDTNSFIGSLESYNKFKKRSGKTDSIEYLNNIFKPDVTLEIANKVLPIIAEGSLLSKLPKGTSEDKVAEIKKQMLINAQEQYDKCMQPHYEKIAYGEKKSIKELIEIRSKNRELYCEKNPKECDETSCSGKVNMFTDKPSPSDTDIIQGCVMGAVTTAIKPILNYSVEVALVDIKDDYKLSDDDIDDFKEATWNELLSCSIRNISENYDVEKSDNIEDLINDPKYLEKVPTSNFEKILTRCSTAAEMKVSKEVVGLSLRNHASLKSLFAPGKPVSYKGHTYNTIDELITEINATTYTNCVNSQQLKALKDSEFIPSAMLCRPAIEVSAASVIINQELENAFKGSGIEKSPEAKLILKQFENCASDAQQDSIDQVGSAKTGHLISNDQEATDYLDEKSNFYSCVKTALYATSAVVAEKEYENETKSASDMVTHQSTITRLKTQVGENVRECFEKELSSSEKWSDFLAFNDNDGINKTKEICSEKATQFSLSSIIYKETIDTLKPLVTDKYLRAQTHDIGSIMAQSSAKLRRIYKIDLPENVKGDDIITYSLAQAYSIYSKKPGASLDGFVDQYSKIATNYAVKKIHSNLKSDIVTETKNESLTDRFTSALDSSCLESVYTKFMQNSPSDEEGMKMDKLTSYISSGLEYSKGVSSDFLNASLKRLKENCKNMDQFKNEAEFEQSELYRLIVRGQLYDLFTSEFTDSILGNIDDQIKMAEDPYKSIKLTALENMRKEMVELLDKEVNNPSAFEKNILADGSILQFALDNLKGLQKDDKSTLDLITKKLIKKLYSNQDTGKFSDEFARINIEAQISLGGVSDAVHKANEGATYLNIFGHRVGPNYYAMSEAKKLFGSPSRMAGIVDWKNISSTQRKKYQTAILEHAVLPTLEDSDPKLMESSYNSLYYSRVKNNPNSKLDYMAGQARELAISQVNMEFAMEVSLMSKSIDASLKKNPHQDKAKLIRKMAYQKAIFASSAPGIDSVNVEGLTQFYISKYHETNLSSDVEDKLLSYKYKNGKTLEDKIEDAITAKTKERMFGTKESREKYRQERLWREATSKWPTGSKL